jgi:hypothetical protein
VLFRSYRILGAALLVGLFGWWPVPIGNQGGYDPRAQLLPRGLLPLAPNGGNFGTVEFTWRGLELIVGNYYVVTLLVFIAATAAALVLTRRIRPERAQSVLRARCRIGGSGRPASPGREISFLNESPGTPPSRCERTPPDETASHALVRGFSLTPPASRQGYSVNQTRTPPSRGSDTDCHPASVR